MTIDMVMAIHMIATVMIVVMSERGSCVEIVKRSRESRGGVLLLLRSTFQASWLFSASQHGSRLLQLFASRRWSMRVLIRLLVRLVAQHDRLVCKRRQRRKGLGVLSGATAIQHDHRHSVVLPVVEGGCGAGRQVCV
jgi:hypothetical protein